VWVLSAPSDQAIRREHASVEIKQVGLDRVTCSRLTVTVSGQNKNHLTATEIKQAARVDKGSRSRFSVQVSS
jgi:hypothetical protein